MRIILLLLACLSIGIAFAQNPTDQMAGKPASQAPTQVVKGRVTDAASLAPLPGALVVVMGTDPLLGTATDGDGYFRLPGVPLGRQTLQVRMVGYEAKALPNMLIITGKETVLQLTLQEAVQALDAVTITAGGAEGKNPHQAKNEMSLLSARSFDVEETRRYAGSRNDPARMASNFAGVSGANDGRNDIIIRGNSPTGLLWRVDGADVYNPSHFGSLSATGGPVSMLNNNTLDRSDFLTGSFASEYGNALSGVFDLSLRTGNQEKREYTGQIGFNGFEAGLEGPFIKKSRASYLVNYRYSLLAAVSKLGVSFGTGAAVPYYQDLTFKINLPSQRYGALSIFGAGGASNIRFLGKDADSTNLYSDPYNNSRFQSKTGFVGVRHTYSFSEKTYGQLLLYATGNGNTGENDTLSDGNSEPRFRQRSIQGRLSARYMLGHKVSARLSFKAGLMADQLSTNLKDSIFTSYPGGPGWQVLHNTASASYLYQGYGQAIYRPSARLTLTGGLHSQYYQAAGSGVIEPRAAASYNLPGQQTISLATGVHSQLQPLLAYEVRTRLDDGTYTQTNRNLDLTRALHLVAGYGKQLGPNTRIKAETYYQRLWNVPVEQRTSSYSVLNEGADFNNPDTDSLRNTGIGRNYGLELTLERTYSKGYYFLITTSLYKSEFQGSDGTWRSTAFDGSYVANALAGKEWKLNAKSVFALDMKLTAAGGRRVTPVDLATSLARKQAIYQTDKAFNQQLPGYFRLDLKASYRINLPRVSHDFFVDVQNITNRQNPYQQYFDPARGRIVRSYQLGLFPNVNYRVQF